MLGNADANKTALSVRAFNTRKASGVFAPGAFVTPLPLDALGKAQVLQADEETWARNIRFGHIVSGSSKVSGDLKGTYSLELQWGGPAADDVLSQTALSFRGSLFHVRTNLSTLRPGLPGTKASPSNRFLF